MRCDGCAKELPEGALVCPFCARPVADAATSLPESPDEAATSLDAGPVDTGVATSGGTASDLDASDSGHGRFLPGAIVADRYRVVGLLGRGGMGEVYRADDLKLGQPVALKFLPDRLVANEDDVRRLFDEVRMARKVSHPNVCRVFDVGETKGQHYVSMEYVDGEDLSSLLRRIGRLPEDKAVEIARQLCAALAAAHEEGVLHRDLKPANIMLDGRGRVKLTDFGLAAVAEVRAGTPVYMAPEQLAGKEVSERSDIYSLGLVLHELLTGKRVFEADDFEELSRLHQSDLNTSLGDSERIDPGIDRVVRRCLERDPDRRPQSALAVAAGLPGADPLAAALAAGETPSPEMVAEAGGEGSLPLAIAAPLLLLTLVLPFVIGALQARTSLVAWVPFDLSPELLDARAVETLEQLGYPTEYEDTEGAFAVDRGYLRWLARQEDPTEAELEVVSRGRSGSIYYWWRGSPDALVPGGTSGASLSNQVTLDDPPLTVPGMVAAQLDTTGRLIWLEAVPPRVAPEPEGEPASPDWDVLFELMGLDAAEFESAPPRFAPPHYADLRAAWTGPMPGNPAATLRVEIATLAGQPVSLRLFTGTDPLAPDESPTATSDSTGFGTTVAVIAILLLVAAVVLTVIFGGLYVAQRNVRSGRGDARGARRLGFGIAIAIGVAWLLAEHRFAPEEINAFLTMLIFVTAFGGLTWALYLAVEPFLRRRAPQTLIGWTRILDGQWADPLVARDVLVGCAAATVTQTLSSIPRALAPRIDTVLSNALLPPSSTPELLGAVINAVTSSVIIGLALSFLYSLSFLASGMRRWLTFAAWLTVLGGIGFVPGLTINDSVPSATIWTSVLWAVAWALWLYVLFWRGLLTFVVMSTFALLLSALLPELAFDAWYASTTIAGLVLLFAVALHAFYRCVPWRGHVLDRLGGA